MTRAALSLVLVLAVVALVTAACGGGGGEKQTGGGGGQTLQLAADPGGALDFDKASLEASAGTITIELTNDSSIPHDVVVEGNGVKEGSDIITKSTTSLTVELDPGTYTFYCSVDKHREAGMEGTLTVK